MSTPPGAGSPSPPPPPPQDLTLPPNPIPLLPAPPQPSINPRRLPPPCWSHDETVALIDAYRDKWYTLRRGNLKANHWQEVADSVARRCPAASPAKTAVQCRHKMEKLRKRYRTEIQRARSMPVSRFSSSWVHFKRMDAMEKGPQAKTDYNSGSDDEDEKDEEDEDNINNQGSGFYIENQRNGGGSIMNTRSIHKLYRNGIGSNNMSSGASASAGAASGFRIRIPTATGVSIAQPAPKFYDHKYANSVPKPNYGGGSGSGSGSGTGLASSSRFLRGSASANADEIVGKKRERDPVEEMVSSIKVLGDGFVRMEQMKMEMAREIETMRMDMEMKRTEMILESQQRIVEAFAKAFSEKKKKKKPKRLTSSPPES